MNAERFKPWCYEGMEFFKALLMKNGRVPHLLMAQRPEIVVPMDGLPRALWNGIARELADVSECVVNVSEAWKAEVDEKTWAAGDRRPAGERDERTEVLMFEAAWKEGRIFLQQEFEHDWDGKIKWIGEVVELPKIGFSRVMEGLYE